MGLQKIPFEASSCFPFGLASGEKYANLHIHQSIWDNFALRYIVMDYSVIQIDYFAHPQTTLNIHSGLYWTNIIASFNATCGSKFLMERKFQQGQESCLWFISIIS
jgi:hypothetical protein